MKELPDADRDNFANSGQCSSCNAHAMIHCRTFAKLDEVLPRASD